MSRRGYLLLIKVAVYVCMACAIVFATKYLLYATDVSVYFEVAGFCLIAALVFMLMLAIENMEEL